MVDIARKIKMDIERFVSKDLLDSVNNRYFRLLDEGVNSYYNVDFLAYNNDKGYIAHLYTKSKVYHLKKIDFDEYKVLDCYRRFD